MIFDIDTTPDRYFRQLVEILRILAPINALRKRQREVFGELLYYDYKYSKESPELANRLLFDQKTKEEISKKLGITKANLYNIFKELRKLQIILKDEINPKYRYKYLQHKEISFRFRDKTGVQ